MFDSKQPCYITRGIDDKLSHELQLFLWNAVYLMCEPKDYFQVFELSTENGMQVIHHFSEDPEYDMTYILTVTDNPIEAKVYVIDSAEYCTMLLAEEY